MGTAIIVLGVLLSSVFAGLMVVAMSRRVSAVRAGLTTLEEGLKEREGLLTEVQGLYGQMVDIAVIREKVKELRTLEEALKAERGRITITQAELETVETRLRELEEIERELEASGIETKEELNILQKKHAEMQQKNQALKGRISKVSDQLASAMSGVEMSAQMQGQVETMKTQLIGAQEKIDTLLLEVEEANDQYFILKRRYDALDIEYAQLYEKFSESEAGGRPAE